MRIVKDAWTYLGQSQPVFVRVLHLMVICMVVGQLITSNVVDLDHARRLGDAIYFDFETLTGLVVVYLIGHGGMGLLHIFLWMRSIWR